MHACTYCHRVPRKKTAAFIWAHATPAGRRAYRTRSCGECLEDAKTAFGPPLPSEGEYIQLPTSCELCGDPVKPTELSISHVTYYDADGEHKDMYAVCDACGAARWALIAEQGELLEDRQPQNRRRAA